MLARVLVTPLREIYEAEIELRVCRFGVYADGFLVLAQRSLGIRSARVDLPEIEARVEGLGIGRYRGVEALRRGVGIALEQALPLLGQRFGIVCSEFRAEIRRTDEGLLECGDGNRRLIGGESSLGALEIGRALHTLGGLRRRGRS